MTEKEANTNYGFSDIHRYLNGQMTAKQMHDMERAALQDPFLADAIEGYQNSNREQSEQHLNEITAALQGNHQEAKIIGISKQKNYRWLAAASALFVIGISVFVLYQNNENSKTTILASNDIKRGKNKDSFRNEKSHPVPLQQDSVVTTMQDATIPAKPKTEKKNETAIARRKEPEQHTIAAASPSKKEDSTLIAAAPATLSYRSKEAAEQSSLSTTDTQHNISAEKEPATSYKARSFAPSSQTSWTTDKGKPFLLSQVEVINMGKTKRKVVDTSSIKPEGGWLLFQDYLFGKLNKKDSSAIANRLNNLRDVELEFSITETGSPYDVHVTQSPDSTTANKVATAIEGGPKWISKDKKEKRLKLKF